MDYPVKALGEDTCPVCSVSSVYTNGRTACSLKCALEMVREKHQEFDIPLDQAIDVVSREFRARGLPSDPAPEDRFRYRYVKVHEKWKSRYWKIDRSILLDSGLNVEYAWVGQDPNRSRVYRFSPQSLGKLPGFMGDYKVRSFSDDDMNYLLSCWEPYWHFLEAPDDSEES